MFLLTFGNWFWGTTILLVPVNLWVPVLGGHSFDVPINLSVLILRDRFDVPFLSTLGY